MVGIIVEPPQRFIGRLPVPRQPFRLDRPLIAADGLGLEIIAVKLLRARVLNEAAAVRRLAIRLRPRGLHRHVEMVLVDPPEQAAARGLPLPDFDAEAGRRSKVQAALRQRRRLAFDRLRSGVVGAVAGDNDRQLGEQRGELVLVIGSLVAEIISVVQDMPAVLLLHQRKMFQRPGRVIPHETEIRVFAIMDRADLDRRLALAVIIATERGEHRERLDRSPNPVGQIAVEHRTVGLGDAPDKEGVLGRPVNRHGDCYSAGCGHRRHQKRAKPENPPALRLFRRLGLVLRRVFRIK